MDPEILIKIRTAIESGGLDAAKNLLKDLTAETQKNTTANTDSEKATLRSQKAYNGILNIVTGLKAAWSSGSVEGIKKAISGISETVDSFAGSNAKLVGSIGAVGTALAAGFTVGQKLDQLLGLSDKIANAFSTKLPPSMELTRQKLLAIADVKFTGLFDQLEQLITINEKYNAQLDITTENGKKLEEAKYLRDKADIEQSLTGDEKDQALKELDQRRSTGTATVDYEASVMKANKAELLYNRTLAQLWRQMEDQDNALSADTGMTTEEKAREKEFLGIKNNARGLAEASSREQDLFPRIDYELEKLRAAPANRLKLKNMYSEGGELDTKVKELYEKVQQLYIERDTAIANMELATAKLDVSKPEKVKPVANRTALAEKARSTAGDINAEINQTTEQRRALGYETYGDSQRALDTRLKKLLEARQAAEEVANASMAIAEDGLRSLNYRLKRIEEALKQLRNQ